MKANWFAIAGHEWFPADWRKDFKPEDIVRESPSGKSILVRLNWAEGEQPAVTKNPEDSVGVGIDVRVGLDTLFFRATKGDKVAANRLAEILRTACSKFTKLCRQHPELFQRVARQSWRWPVMMSKHPFLCDDYKALLNDLKLGEDTPLELSACARWIWDDAADIAFGLLCYLWESRNENRKPHVDYGKFGQSVDRLPEFSADSACEWWQVAQVVLLFSYPAPQNIPELAALVTAPSKRRFPSTMKQEILDKLKARFAGFAPPARAYRT